MTDECGITRPSKLRIMWCYVVFWGWLIPGILLRQLIHGRP